MFAESDERIPYDVYDMLDDRSVEGEYTIEGMIRPFRPIPEDDVILMPSLGGSSYGDVLERDPELVVGDLKSRICTDWTAQNVYHVVYDPDSFRVDYDATEKAREAEREKRKERGRSYDEFEAEWLQKTPPPEAITRYGDWPNP